MIRTYLTALVVAAVVTSCAPRAQDGEHKTQEAVHHGDDKPAGDADGHRPEPKGERGEEGEAGEGHEGEKPGNEVRLTEAAQAKAGVKVAPVRMQEVDATLTTTGAIADNGDRLARVTPRAAGRVVRVIKTVGDRVRAGDALAMLESTELGRAQAEYLEAQARHELARTTAERQRKLYKGALTATKDIQAAENQLRLSQIDLEKTRNNLLVLGFTEGRIATLTVRRRIEPSIPLLAPLAGVVVERNVTPGETIEPGAAQPAFVLTDTSVLWANATLYERDLAQVRRGQVATVSTAAFPGRSFQGRVELVSTRMDKSTRTATARIVINNADGLLKPDMPATVRVRVGKQRAIAVPESAVLHDKDQTFVFVQKEPEAFEKRLVSVAEGTGNFQPVLSGLSLEDKVVVEGGFTLKSELLKGSFGEEE